MFKYKNVTKGILKFRAFDENRIKKKFELKPDKEVELGTIASMDGLELVKEKEKIKKIKQGDK